MKTETESKHTPGPWKVADEAPHCILGPANTGLGIVATAAREGTHGKEGRANARLIAAAPDMFEALEGVLRVADRATVEFDAVRAALIKAGKVFE